MTEFKKSTDGVALITDAVYFEPIDPTNPKTPYGSKCQLINKEAGVTHIDVLKRSNKFFTHYAPLAKFRPEEK